MKKLLALVFALVFALPALADGLPMYEDRMLGGTYPRNAPVRLYISDSNWFGGFRDAVTIDLGIDQRVPVYAFPGEEGWRAADGRAAVSLREPFTALGWSADGQWLLIDYTLGEANALGTYQHRIGYIRRDALPQGFTCPVARECLVRVPMRLTREGSLTDDLNGLMKPVGVLPAGAEVMVLGWVNNAWAYVEVQQEGCPARLFLPMAVLEKPDEQADAAMMSELAGLWLFVGGGEILGDGCRFDGLGTVEIYAAGQLGSFPTATLVTCEGSTPWACSVYPNTLGTMRYPSAQWVLEICGENGGYERMGVTLSTDEATGGRFLAVEYGPGGGGYRFVPDESGITFVTRPAPDAQ